MTHQAQGQRTCERPTYRRGDKGTLFGFPRDQLSCWDKQETTLLFLSQRNCERSQQIIAQEPSLRSRGTE